MIITSATIDPERFARHFGDAPIVLVEGRSFPVDVRYRPVDEDQDLATAVTAAANELAAERREGPIRDQLVFLPGERWIRDAERALARYGPKGTSSCRSTRGSRARGSARSSRPAKHRGSCSRRISPRHR